MNKFLIDWKNDKEKLSLIVKDTKQIGKTNSIKYFGENNYKSIIKKILSK